MRHLKNYLPTHSVFHKFAAQYLCSFADAIRTKRAEAKGHILPPYAVLRDAIRTKRAEAKTRDEREYLTDLIDAIHTNALRQRALHTPMR